MHPDEAAFLAAIRANLDDDTPRLVFADWLEEHGEVARAAFIRTQVELARLPPGDARVRQLRDRLSRLLARFKDRWLGELLRAAPRPCWTFRRGFPVPALRGRMLAPQTVLDVVASPHFGPPTHLDLRDSHPVGEGAALFASGALAGLTHLHLGSSTFAGLAIRSMTDPAVLPRVEILSLYGNRIGAEQLRALAAWPGLAGVAHLNLDNNPLGDEGVRVLAASPHVAGLKRLCLFGTGISDAGVRALASSPHLRGLSHLNLAWNRIGDEGARALAASPYLAGLQELTCTRSECRPELRARFGDRLREWP